MTLAYDTLNRLTSSPLGSYTYGDSAHLHAATAAAGTSSYTASYDAAGGMTCRAPNGTTCAGTPTGAQLVYDAERRLKHWQDTPSRPMATDDYLYDGAGQRIQKLSASGGTSTLTSYIGGGVEEAQSVNGGAVTLTKYLGAPGLPQAIRVGTGGTLSYLASDGLSSVSEALDSGSGTVTAQQLYAPYGGARYTNGNMPTSKGFTGQRADSGSSGLDYYGARSYDPVLGQFASAYRCRRLRGDAAFGKDTLARQTFYGLRVQVRVEWPGMITRFCVAAANVHELSMVPALVEQTRARWWAIGTTGRRVWLPNATHRVSTCLRPTAAPSAIPTPAGVRNSAACAPALTPFSASSSTAAPSSASGHATCGI